MVRNTITLLNKLSLECGSEKTLLQSLIGFFLFKMYPQETHTERLFETILKLNDGVTEKRGVDTRTRHIPPLLDFAIQCGTTIELKLKTFYSNLYLKFPLMIEPKHMDCTNDKKKVVQNKVKLMDWLSASVPFSFYPACFLYVFK